MHFMMIYYIAVNVLAFVLYGADKGRAKRDQWRIPESTLLGIALIGGGVGAWAGMQMFRHKTKHWHFKILVPIFILLHAGLILYMGN